MIEKYSQRLCWLNPQLLSGPPPRRGLLATLAGFVSRLVGRR